MEGVSYGVCLPFIEKYIQYSLLYINVCLSFLFPFVCMSGVSHCTVYEPWTLSLSSEDDNDDDWTV